MPKALQDEVVTDSGLKFFIDPTFKPEMQATVVSTVFATPLNPKYEKYASQIKVGDEVCMSYQVVADRRFNSDADYFQEATEGSPYFRKFFNAKDECIQIRCIPTAISKIWAATYTSKSGELISGVQGKESDLERWMAQFKYGSDDNFTFRNLWEIDGQDFWKCSPEQIFAKRVGDEILPVGDRLIMKPIDIDIKSKMEIMNGAPLPYQELSIRLYDRAELVHDCADLDLKKGDVVSFQAAYCEKYEFFGELYFLIRKRNALGTWQTEI